MPPPAEVAARGIIQSIDGFRKSAGSLAIFAAIRSAPIPGARRGPGLN
jgi:hypothetical protein